MKNKFIAAVAFLNYLNFSKVGNYLLLAASFQISRLSKKSILWGCPTTLSIEPTTSCNLRCPECPSGLRAFSRPTGMLQEELFKKVILESKSHLTWLHLYFQGEPFLNPNFLKMVAFADQHKIYTSTSTNAHYLNEKNVTAILNSGLKQLIISMDGITQEVYQHYRIGGKLDKVKTGLTLLLEERKKRKSQFPRVILQFLVTGQNESQLPELKQWSKNMKVDELQLKTTQIYDYENGSDLIPSDLNYSRYIPTGNGKWKLKKKMENKCWRMWQGAVVTWDGKVVPCCFDKDATHTMGSLQEEPLNKVWRSAAYDQFRLQLLSDRTQIDICKNCTE